MILQVKRARTPRAWTSLLAVTLMLAGVLVPASASASIAVGPETRVRGFGLPDGPRVGAEGLASRTPRQAYGLWYDELASDSPVAPSSGFTGLSRDALRYARDIEAQTGLRIHPAQRQQLADTLRGRRFEKLSTEAAREHRAAFNRTRSDLIAQWEQRTGQQWPRYTADVVNEQGVVLRRAGQPFDAHHIIESNYGGPNQWWNIHPAAFPGQHQGGIHRAGGVARQIFE